MTEQDHEKKSDLRRMKAILVLAASIAFVSAPFWSSGFGGFDPEDFPVPTDSPMLQPAGYVFGIWGIIYVWLVLSAGCGLFMRAEDPDWDRVRWWLIASLALGTPWISVANASPVWATVLIVGMLIPALFAQFSAPRKDRWLLRAPVALYSGWLTVATAVSVGVLLTGYGAPLLAWAALLVVLAGAGCVLWILQGASLYGFSIAWGLGGIVAKNLAADNHLVASGTFLLTLFFIWASIRSERGTG